MLHKTFTLTDWQSSKTTLHCFLQIVGKIRMKLHPKRNHWWHVTHYVTATGLTTGPIPYQNRIFQLEFDFLQHQCRIVTSFGQIETFSLKGQCVADFHQQLFEKLLLLNIKVKIFNKPFDPNLVQSDIPFAEDKVHVYDDPDSVQQFWRILLWIYPIFQQFAGRFDGKTTPVHLYWHSMDYAVTRFSGRKAPTVTGMDRVSAEAYSHEVISFGFWPGDLNLPEPAFYSYTYPKPDGLMKQPLQPPSKASWVEVNNSPMALLKYSDLIKLNNPEKSLMQFLQSAYNAGARLAKW